jgi:hypothetical protein
MDMPVKLELAGLSDLDRDDLEVLFADSGVKTDGYEFQDRPATADRTQDFGLTTLVLLTIGPPAIAVIGAWLSKKRESGQCKATVRAWDENGQKRYESEFNWNSSRAAPPPAEVIEKLAQASKVDPDKLQQALAKLKE